MGSSVVAPAARAEARLLSSLRDPGHVKWLNRAFGSMFIAAGTLLATFRRAA